MSIAKLPKVASQFEEQLKPKPEKKAVDFNSKEVQDFIESARTRQAQVQTQREKGRYYTNDESGRSGPCE